MEHSSPRLAESAAVSGQEDWADARLGTGMAEEPGQLGQFLHQYQKRQPACSADVTETSVIYILFPGTVDPNSGLISFLFEILITTLEARPTRENLGLSLVDFDFFL